MGVQNILIRNCAYFICVQKISKKLQKPFSYEQKCIWAVCLCSTMWSWTLSMHCWVIAHCSCIFWPFLCCFSFFGTNSSWILNQCHIFNKPLSLMTVFLLSFRITQSFSFWLAFPSVVCTRTCTRTHTRAHIHRTGMSDKASGWVHVDKHTFVAGVLIWEVISLKYSRGWALTNNVAKTHRNYNNKQSWLVWQADLNFVSDKKTCQVFNHDWFSYRSLIWFNFLLNLSLDTFCESAT